uniref:Glyco_hydro_19_cat domain-containing protein n=1 Tax=Angiostrongylus cantonensis TaxID=6313 RepID=A0A0K0D237_ANGCA
LGNLGSYDFGHCVIPRSQCPDAAKYGTGPPFSCVMPSDPNNLPPSSLEQWFTKDVFEDLFPFANIGWGPHPCSPYSYEAFVIAARYFPKFGTSSPNTTENTRRDLAAFFAHAIQETGENNAALYRGDRSETEATDCFYRGGLYNWFEGGPVSSLLDSDSPGFSPSDGNKCIAHGYCVESPEIDFFYPCTKNRTGNFFTGCYFGRGAIQISYNYNYGQFMDFLESKNIHVDLLSEPNLVMTKTNPPLALLASLWFYMTPQPPKPAMHDIVMGTWNSGKENAAAGYSGPIFGPTSLVINNECSGEDMNEPGGPGESRRIKAFKWLCSYFGVPAGDESLLSCKNMPVKFESLRYNYSYQPDWSTIWKEQPCDCVPAPYGGDTLDVKRLLWSSVNCRLITSFS